MNVHQPVSIYVLGQLNLQMHLELKSIEDAFERIGNKSFTNKLVGINVDGARVNLGKHRGVGRLVQEKATWLQVIYCFKHRVELALRDTFKTTAFEDIDIV